MQELGLALNMKVLVAERKGATSTKNQRTPFEDVLRDSTVLMLGCPLDESTRGMIGEAELQQMGRESILVNVARGGVVDEAALVKALERGWISSAATDVFSTEPATPTSTPLIANCPANLTLSPHVAWYADSSLETLQRLIKHTVESYVQGRVINLVK